jgi:hypothetical protein
MHGQVVRDMPQLAIDRGRIGDQTDPRAVQGG